MREKRHWRRETSLKNKIQNEIENALLRKEMHDRVENQMVTFLTELRDLYFSKSEDPSEQSMLESLVNMWVFSARLLAISMVFGKEKKESCFKISKSEFQEYFSCLLYTSPSPRD